MPYLPSMNKDLIEKEPEQVEAEVVKPMVPDILVLFERKPETNREVTHQKEIQPKTPDNQR